MLNTISSRLLHPILTRSSHWLWITPGVLEITPQAEVTNEPQVFNIGDTLPITTGVILDHNGNQVPDGTIARFIISTGTDVVTSQQIETITINGIAKASYTINEPGRVEIRVVSEPAMVSNVLQLEVKEGEGSQVTAIAPTAVFTPTPLSAPTLEENGSADPDGEPNLSQIPAVFRLACLHYPYRIGHTCYLPGGEEEVLIPLGNSLGNMCCDRRALVLHTGIDWLEGCVTQC